MPAFVVLTNQRLTTTTQLLTLQNRDHDHPFHFQAGQYAAISFKWRGRPTTVRCFSIVSPPTDNGILQLGIQIKGRYTRTITLLEQGDIVNVLGAFGNFSVNKIRDRNIVLLAGGIGITPFMSIVRYLTRLREEIKITLVYSCHDEHDAPFAEELMAMEQLHENFRVVFVISSGIKSRFIGKRAAAGRITSNIMDLVTNRLYLDKTFFICGSASFMQGMQTLLTTKGTPQERVITESFNANHGSICSSGRNWPHRVYSLTAAALVLGLLIVMFTDFVHTMPVLSVNMNLHSSDATTSNEKQLEQQVNALSTQPAGVKTLSSARPSRL